MSTTTAELPAMPRRALGLGLLFTTSFLATWWLVSPSASVSVEAARGHAGQDGADAPPGRDLPPARAELQAQASMEPAADPAPEQTLQDLVTDDDPAVRDEAQVLLGLVNAEGAYD